MNYLAHAFLSFGDADIIAGNMISDFVKGRAQYDFPLPIQKGIRLHRMIDNFTDTHKATAAAKEYFRPQYRLYSGAFVDVVYDHFLATDKIYFIEDADLMRFSKHSYSLINENILLLPQKFQRMFPFMQQRNWLYNYQFMAGIENSFRDVAYRAAYLYESAIAFSIFQKNYDELKNCYCHFFGDLYRFSRDSLDNLLAG